MQGAGFRYRRRAKLYLMACSIVLALMCAEGMLRLAWHNPYRFDRPDRMVMLRLQQANSHHKIDRSAIEPDDPWTQLRTDSRSYILPAAVHDQPDCTIAFLGGSTTECRAVAEPLRFPARVASRLADAGLRVNALNSGTSGNTLHDSINNLFNHIIDDQPDIAVLMHACNDIGVLRMTGDYSSRSGNFIGWKALTRSSLMELSRHSWLVALGRQTVREHYRFVPVPPQELKAMPDTGQGEELQALFEQRLRAFIVMCEEFDIVPVIMTQPTSGRFNELTPVWANQHAQARFNDVIRRVGREKGVMVIDLVEHLASDVPDWDQHMRVFYDGVHVTDRGSQIYGDYIAANIENLARQICTESAEPIKTPQILAERPGTVR